MKKLRSPAVALPLVLLAVALSIVLGTRRSLTILKTELHDAFYSASQQSGDDGIYTDLKRRVELARNLEVVAGRYLPADLQPLKGLSDAAGALAEAEGIPALYEANLLLTRAAAAVDEALGNCALSDADTRYRVGIRTDLASTQMTIERDGYNARAIAFNTEVLGSFPVRYLKYAAFVDRAEVFS